VFEKQPKLFKFGETNLQIKKFNTKWVKYTYAHRMAGDVKLALLKTKDKIRRADRYRLLTIYRERDSSLTS
jgi:hypothetical protein